MSAKLLFFVQKFFNEYKFIDNVSNEYSNDYVFNILSSNVMNKNCFYCENINHFYKKKCKTFQKNFIKKKYI